MATFSEAVVGDRVWDVGYGWGKILNIISDVLFPLQVGFEHNLGCISFSYDGKERCGQLNPTLFWDEVVITPPERPKHLCSFTPKCECGKEIGSSGFATEPKEECEACKLIEFAKWRWDTIKTYSHADLEKDVFLLSHHHVEGCEKKNA